MLEKLESDRKKEIYKATKKGIDQLFKIKRVDSSRVNYFELKEDCKRELSLSKKINHKNVVKFYEILEIDHYVYFIFEYCNGGKLSDCIEKYRKKYGTNLPENYCLNIIKQMVEGVAYLHSKNIMHRDIKLDNFNVQFDNDEDKNNLNFEKAIIKIINLEVSRILEKGEMATTVVGSFNFMDPKIKGKAFGFDYSENFEYDYKADIWSLGCTCYELVTGIAFADYKPKKTLENSYEAGEIQFPLSLNLSVECMTFISEMLYKDENERKDAATLLKHPFLTKDISKFHKVYY